MRLTCEKLHIFLGFNPDTAGAAAQNVVGSGASLFDFDPGPGGGNGAIPEPLTATLGLMGLATLGMATRRRAA